MSAEPRRIALVREARSHYEKRVRHAKADLRTFVELAARNEEGHAIELDYIHRAWIWHVNYCWSRGLRAMILAPFNSGKSSTLAVPLAAWLIGNNPQIRIKYISNADEFAKRRVSATKKLVESAVYKQVFPAIRPGARWTDHVLEVHRKGFSIDPTLEARGVKTQGVGLRAEVIICDDVCDQLNTRDEGQRALIKGLCTDTWFSRLDPATGRALWVATPWHPDDATHDFMHSPRWCTLIQSVDDDLEHYRQEVINAGSDYLLGRPA